MSTPDFVPYRSVVTAITNANPAVVTAANHGLVADQIVRINVPQTYQMDFNGIQASIVAVVNVNTFSINQNTLWLDAFVVPGLAAFTTAEVLPITGTTDNIAT